MTAGTLADLDPLAVVNAHLLTHPKLRAELDKFDPSGSVQGVVGPPYPCVRALETPGGSLRDATWIVDAEIQLEVWDDEQNSHASAALRRLLMVGVAAIKELEGRDVTEYDAVVSNVSAGAPYPLPNPDGQARWLTTLTLTMRPPLTAPQE